MKFLVRVDATDVIGFGHLSRCLNIARKLSHFGLEAVFVISSRSVRHYTQLVAGEFQSIIIDDSIFCGAEINKNMSPTEREELDAKAVISKTSNCRFSGCIVDHYFLGGVWHQIIRSSIRNLIVIDDLANKYLDCDLVVNTSLSCELKSKYVNLISETTRLFLGPKYMVLGDHYYEKKLVHKVKNTENPEKEVLIYFGSNDQNNLTLMAAEACLDAQNVYSNIVVTSNHPHLSKIVGISNNKRIKLFVNCEDMAALIANCDFAFGVCGISAWERCFFGKPTICAITAENQVADAVALENLGAICLLGRSENLTSSQMLSAIREFIGDKEQFDKMSFNARGVMQENITHVKQLIEAMCYEIKK